MALPAETCPECGAARAPRAAGCRSCGAIFQDVSVAGAARPVADAGRPAVAAGLPDARTPAPHAAAEPHPDDARAESGSGCRSCLLLALICAGLTIVALIATWLLVREDALGLVESFERAHAEARIERLADELESWAAEHGGRLPDALEALQFTPVRLSDDWNRPYRYDPAPDRKSARLSTLGADNTPGGDGRDADLARTIELP